MIKKKTYKAATECNTEKLVRLMDYAQSGPLIQAFIMGAILEKAEAVVEHYKANPEELNEPSIVSLRAWNACAQEIVATYHKTWEEIDEGYKKAESLKAQAAEGEGPEA